MLLSLCKKVYRKAFSGRNGKAIANCRKIVSTVNSLEPYICKMSDDELKDQTKILKNRLQQGELLDDILPDAFAVVRETAKRLLNMRHYDVQLIGGILLHRGCVVEMKTGEGKTLSATLPIYLNALTTNVHIITVNDYLAKRDYDWMGRIFDFLGLKVSYVISKSNLEERANAYSGDVVYVTNSEIGFDYLRDNMQMDRSKILLGESSFQYAIIDEIDSILIDEARTPLIISGPNKTSSDLYLAIDKIARKINDDTLFIIDEKRNTVQLTEEGEDFVEAKLKAAELIKQNSSLYDTDACALLNHVLQSLKAHHCFKKDKDYIIVNDSVMLIDEFTGRVAEGRRYSGGLHQALEAKEKVQIGSENKTLASVTYQNFFRMYKKLSGMTGTAMTEANEFYNIYELEVFSVPTFTSIARKDHQDFVFRTEKEKLNYICNLVKKRNKEGQPILIGTVSIQKSEIYSSHLLAIGVKHNVLNAKYHEKEAQIIAEAGRKKSVTIATNMAGRGTDILLGGSIDSKILFAIDGITDTKEITNITEKIRQEHEVERAEVVRLGGLFVIGSERHESRRVDNQLQGRAGRLGDPGISQFFLCLQDDLLRVFGGDRLDAVLRRLGLKEGEPMQHAMLDNVIERSQKKLENFHYEIRKNIVRYDDIINEQRKLIYQQRNFFLKENSSDIAIKKVIHNLNNSLIGDLVKEQGFVSHDVIISELHSVYKNGFLKNIPNLLLNCDNEITLDNLPQTVKIVDKLIFDSYRQKVASISDGVKKVEQFVLLNSLDSCWQEHLNKASHIREGIHLRTYSNKDPFTEYKKEMFLALEETFYNFDFCVVQHLISIEVDRRSEQNYLHVAENQLQDGKIEQTYGNIVSSKSIPLKSNTDTTALIGSGNYPHVINRQNITNRYIGKKVARQGRNEKCSCNSGKKYKNCHGK
ncbi:MAG: preprotein translocase subunit SecA [Alphaproteobacteria bacterium]|nr:preprotein translocase subunit SecA [Rickettsiales bacterium]